GTRDFGPEVVRKRNYILNTIRNIFEVYGFQPLETPAMENLDTLMGKYGEEGDKLIFRILDSGNPFSKEFFQELANYFKANYENIEYLKKNNSKFETIENPFGNSLFNLNPKVLADISIQLLQNKEQGRKYLNEFKNEISSKALKYDLTIPFARYVAMNYAKLTFPFKRYQIQPVWRADRPQKGRYREFYQCDADVVGSKELLNEVELVSIYISVFEKLKIPVEVKINNRKLLQALAETCGGSERMTDITIAIDKLDKIGLAKVKEELSGKGLNENQISIIENYLSVSKHTGNNETILRELAVLFENSPIGKEGLSELKYILQNTDYLAFTSKIWIDPTLARGLNYYTGSIIEIKASGVEMGSIGGGGRYDDLTGLFGVPNIPGVGISFGVDRIYDVMEELKLFPEDIHVGTQVLFFNLGEKESWKAFGLMQGLRQNGIRSELYHEAAKFDKQFKYAEKKNIPFVVIIGEEEMNTNTVKIKNLKTGEQQTYLQEKLSEFVFN
ncbi:MAG: histidine--tRNA ligase, partial [Chitinophagaceae bacterium]